MPTKLIVLQKTQDEHFFFILFEGIYKLLMYLLHLKTTDRWGSNRIFKTMRAGQCGHYF